MQHKNIELHIRDESLSFDAILIEHRIPAIINYASNLGMIDYTVIKNKHQFAQAFHTFQNNEITKISNYANLLCPNLRLAINESRCAKGDPYYKPNACDPMVSPILDKIKTETYLRLTAVKSILEALEIKCPKRFNWTVDKTTIENNALSLKEAWEENQKLFRD